MFCMIKRIELQIAKGKINNDITFFVIVENAARSFQQRLQLLVYTAQYILTATGSVWSMPSVTTCKLKQLRM